MENLTSTNPQNQNNDAVSSSDDDYEAEPCEWRLVRRHFPWLTPDQLEHERVLENSEPWMNLFNEELIGKKVAGIEPSLYTYGATHPYATADKCLIDQFHLWIFYKSRTAIIPSLKAISSKWIEFIKKPADHIKEFNTLQSAFFKTNYGIIYFIHGTSLDNRIACAVRPEFGCYCCCGKSKKFNHDYRTHDDYLTLPDDLRTAITRLDRIRNNKYKPRTIVTVKSVGDYILEHLDYDDLTVECSGEHTDKALLTEVVGECVDVKFNEEYNDMKADILNDLDSECANQAENIYKAKKHKMMDAMEAMESRWEKKVRRIKRQMNRRMDQRLRQMQRRMDYQMKRNMKKTIDACIELIQGAIKPDGELTERVLKASAGEYDRCMVRYGVADDIDGSICSTLDQYACDIETE